MSTSSTKTKRLRLVPTFLDLRPVYVGTPWVRMEPTRVNKTDQEGVVRTRKSKGRNGLRDGLQTNGSRSVRERSTYLELVWDYWVTSSSVCVCHLTRNGSRTRGVILKYTGLGGGVTRVRLRSR